VNKNKKILGRFILNTTSNEDLDHNGGFGIGFMKSFQDFWEGKKIFWASWARTRRLKILTRTSFV